MSDDGQSIAPPTVAEFIPRHGNGRLLTPWQKGQSGNPGGNFRNEYNLARKICAENTPRAIERQLELMESEDERVAMVATQAVIERGIGKPRDHSADPPRKIDFSMLTADERAVLEAAAPILRRLKGE
jgi:hypothetical protein